MKLRLLPLAPWSLLVAGLVPGLAACGSHDGADPERRGRDAGASGPAAVELTDHLGCGYGFSVADEAGTTLLSIHRNADSGTVARTVVLPDPAWDAEVLVGSHLAANWCTDVIEEPQADVDETWTVVEGELEFLDQVPPVDGSPADQPVRAQLTGIVVESPDGEQVDLDDLTLVNESWGFFAG